VLTMNRPAARNALNRELIRALYAALKAADSDESVRTVVLTGADPAFCAGVDLKEAASDGLKYFAEFKSNSCISAVAEMRTRPSERSTAPRSPAASSWRWGVTS
jgi:enoyl-CoA hydratase